MSESCQYHSIKLMLIPIQSQISRLSSLGLLISIQLALLSVNAQTAKTFRMPTESEVRALFELATRPLPEKMLLTAEIEILEPPMQPDELERHISESIAENEADEKRKEKLAGGPIAESESDDFETFITNALTKRYSGKRKLWRKEWYSRSGELYRSDSYDFLDLELDPILRTNILSGSIPCLYSKISFARGGIEKDSRFPKGQSMSINHGIQSGSVHTAEGFSISEPELWPALSMNAELSFPIGVLLAKADTFPEEPPFRDMILGVELDEAKLNQALQGEVFGWRITARDDLIDDEQVSRIVLQSQANSFFNQILGALIENATNQKGKEDLSAVASAQFTYWIGKIAQPSGPRLLKVEKSVPGRRRLTATRQWDDSTGLLKSWSLSDQNLNNGEETNTTYHFKHVDLQASFSDEDVFGYGQLQPLQIVSYDKQVIQIPEGTRLIQGPPEKKVDYKLVMAQLILYTVVLLPGIYFGRQLVNSTKSRK